MSSSHARSCLPISLLYLLRTAWLFDHPPLFLLCGVPERISGVIHPLLFLFGFSDVLHVLEADVHGFLGSSSRMRPVHVGRALPHLWIRVHYIRSAICLPYGHCLCFPLLLRVYADPSGCSIPTCIFSVRYLGIDFHCLVFV
ncbi:hypothetical protein BD311DRAFT_489303 [Dichomitus squalens]|uniref:Uncharacterized protein n=1 Tax=Dichomitus squalens TaxID=114155 RepID=A0A4Q9MIE4_9APHY|nr:hypothetical protein BD311DRAFT_489303 [Dichomitus squalens]